MCKDATFGESPLIHAFGFYCEGGCRSDSMVRIRNRPIPEGGASSHAANVGNDAG